MKITIAAIPAAAADDDTLELMAGGIGTRWLDRPRSGRRRCATRRKHDWQGIRHPRSRRARAGEACAAGVSRRRRHLRAHRPGGDQLRACGAVRGRHRAPHVVFRQARLLASGSLTISIVKCGMIDTMNDSFNTPSRAAGRCLDGLMAKLGAGCSGLLRLFGPGDGRFPDVEIAAQKRELEKKLLAAGYSRKLALIAVSEAFARPAKPE